MMTLVCEPRLFQRTGLRKTLAGHLSTDLRHLRFKSGERLCLRIDVDRMAWEQRVRNRANVSWNTIGRQILALLNLGAQIDEELPLPGDHAARANGTMPWRDDGGTQSLRLGE